MSLDPGCLLFVLVLMQEVALRICHGRIFAAPASPLVWGFSSGGCPGLLDQEVVQQVMAVCDQWVWFKGTGGPYQDRCEWFSLCEEQL